MEMSFVKKINKEFFEICKRSSMMCPQELWPYIFRQGSMNISFDALPDDRNKYYLLIMDIAQIIREPINKPIWNCLSKKQQDWLVNSRDYRTHFRGSTENGKLKQGAIVNLIDLWEIIKAINKATNFTPDFIK